MADSGVLRVAGDLLQALVALQHQRRAGLCPASCDCLAPVAASAHGASACVSDGEALARRPSGRRRLTGEALPASMATIPLEKLP